MNRKRTKSQTEEQDANEESNFDEDTPTSKRKRVESPPLPSNTEIHETLTGSPSADAFLSDDEEDAPPSITPADAIVGSLSPSTLAADGPPVTVTVTVVQPSEQAEDVVGPEQYASLSRDLMAKVEEDRGALAFKIVTNDGTIESLAMLLDLKNIFGRQLPKMPKDYIARLVFDKNHRSVVVVRSGQVVGGITFRPFELQAFAEIAFLAITGNLQVKGIGTRLMNHLKDYLQPLGVFRFLTYADNFAIGFFKKQGFTKEITLPEVRYRGYIKDYDGGTLMECVIRGKVNYLDVPGMIKKQREAVYEKMKEISNSHVIYKGLDVFEKGRGYITIEHIPGITEAGWRSSKQRFNTPTVKDIQELQSQLWQVWEAVRRHDDAWPFQEPVSREEVHDYYDVIKDPIDLRTIGERLSTGYYYRNAQMFAQEMRRMFTNCKEYNKDTTEYYRCACRLEAFFKAQMTKYVRFK